MSVVRSIEERRRVAAFFSAKGKRIAREQVKAGKQPNYACEHSSDLRHVECPECLKAYEAAVESKPKPQVRRRRVRT